VSPGSLRRIVLQEKGDLDGLRHDVAQRHAMRAGGRPSAIAMKRPTGAIEPKALVG